MVRGWHHCISSIICNTSRMVCSRSHGPGARNLFTHLLSAVVYPERRTFPTSSPINMTAADLMACFKPHLHCMICWCQLTEDRRAAAPHCDLQPSFMEFIRILKIPENLQSGQQSIYSSIEDSTEPSCRSHRAQLEGMIPICPTLPRLLHSIPTNHSS